MPLTPLRPLSPLNRRPGQDDDEPQDGTASPGSGGSGPTTAVQPRQPGAAVTGRAPTFAELRAQGRARPAPPSAGPATRFTPATGGLRPEIERSVRASLATPSRYEVPVVQQGLQALEQNLDVQRRAARRGIDDVMAARGVYDSTITGDEYGNLEGVLDATRAQYSSDLAREMATTYGADRQSAIAAAMGYDSDLFDRDLATYGANRDAEDTDFARELETARFGEDQYRSDIGDAQADEMLGLERGRFALAERETEQDAALQREEMALRQTMQERELSEAEEAQLRDLVLRREQLSETARDRELRATELGRRFGLDSERQRADLTGQYELGDPGRPANFDPNNSHHQTIANLFQQVHGRNPTQDELTQFAQMAQNSSWSAVQSAIGSRPRRLTEQTLAARGLDETRRQFDQRTILDRDDLALRGRLGDADLSERRLGREQEGRLGERRIDVDERLATNAQLMSIFQAFLPWLADMRRDAGTTPRQPPLPPTPPPDYPPDGPNGPPPVDPFSPPPPVSRADSPYTADARNMVYRVLGRQPTPQELAQLEGRWASTGYDALEEMVRGWGQAPPTEASGRRTTIRTLPARPNIRDVYRPFGLR